MRGKCGKGLEEDELEEDTPEGEIDVFGSQFPNDFFLHSCKEQEKLTRSQKRKDQHAHGLVRAMDQPTQVKAVPVSHQKLQELQWSDESLQEPRARASCTECPDEKEFFWRDGVLLRRGRWNQQEVMESEQVVLPRECRQMVLHLAHTNPAAGHLGRKKTAQRVLRQFYWPNLRRDVADYCRSCQECQKSSRQRPKRAPLVLPPVISEPFSRIAMDIVGPLPRSQSGHRYVLVVCDYATRYPEAVPLRSIDVEAVAETLVTIFSRVGIPQEILTDQGTNFTSQLQAEIYWLIHVRALRTSPYHPQTDGVVEWFNQTLKDMLQKTAREEGKDWDRLIPFVLFAYREVPQASTGFSPFELLYGREVRGPLDVLKEEWEPRNHSDINVASYVLIEKFEEIFKLVHRNMEAAQTTQKKWYDKMALQRKLKAGRSSPGTSTNIFIQVTDPVAPYTVMRPVGEVNYLINMHNCRKKRRILHINMLKKWHVPTSTNYT